MAQKTFKIGEYAKGGIIKVETKKNIINIRVIDMFSNKEISSKVKVINEYDHINSTDIERDLNNYLHDITTSYYASKVMKWLAEKTKLNFIWT